MEKEPWHYPVAIRRGVQKTPQFDPRARSASTSSEVNHSANVNGAAANVTV